MDRDWLCPPGEILEEALQERDMTRDDLADAVGYEVEEIDAIIDDQAPVTHELAVALERAIGVPAGLWDGLETAYRALLGETS